MPRCGAFSRRCINGLVRPDDDAVLHGKLERKRAALARRRVDGLPIADEKPKR